MIAPPAVPAVTLPPEYDPLAAFREADGLDEEQLEEEFPELPRRSIARAVATQTDAIIDGRRTEVREIVDEHGRLLGIELEDLH